MVSPHELFFLQIDYFDTNDERFEYPFFYKRVERSM